MSKGQGVAEDHVEAYKWMSIAWTNCTLPLGDFV